MGLEAVCKEDARRFDSVEKVVCGFRSLALVNVSELEKCKHCRPGLSTNIEEEADKRHDGNVEGLMMSW